MKLLTIGVLLLFLTGCSSYSGVSTVLLPTSNKSIDVVLHRSDVRFMDCGTLSVLQTYDTQGLIDSKSAQGRALHCEVIQAGISAAGAVGAGAVRRPDRINIRNSQSQGQGQGQEQGQSQSQSNTNTNTNTNTANGGQGGEGGQGGQGGQGGNGGNGGNGGPCGGNCGNGEGNGGGNGTGDEGGGND